MNFRNRSADVHQFAMVPSPDIPRSSFRIQRNHKTTFNAGWLIPFLVEEVLPGDTMSGDVTIFCRTSTPVFPIMDNMYVETFFFFVPCRLLWSNWVRFMGEQDNPADSISFTVPTVTSSVGGWVIKEIGDYMGLPTVGQVGGAATIVSNSLPLRAYQKIYFDWFKDENLETMTVPPTGNGPDVPADFALRRRLKRHDYFTSCLPWTQKGGVAVTLPFGTSAPVKTQAGTTVTGVQSSVTFFNTAGGAITANRLAGFATGTSNLATSTSAFGTLGESIYPNNLYADLTAATAVTINQLRQSFQIQKLLERDARGGTRYGELMRAHFGVISPDARLQRSEYLGGGSAPINISAVAQTSATGVTGTPLGNLAAFGTSLAHGHGFSQSFTEHGYLIGLVNVRADLTYQQGMRKLWSRSTRYDFYFPAFAMLGEQAVLNKEIYADGSANDALTFGYQERWAEYRYSPSMVTGLFRSTSAGTLDGWHLAQKFTALPTLNATFIRETPPMTRILAAGAAADGAEIYSDMFIDIKAARPLPLYSVPGLIDHF